ncbi:MULTISPECIES: bifunctional 2-C-methyl-D-erythritol 4-phosphate cytidylyltransferase/2-C-methyl-D-erythritol 2,4-cyclodiphosphate synthase [unclassified Roseitalea]|uniref:bifunctional 2-C-methyl-D-erythritol 4-phosphate cytidylyltransferase/2-C-methyl-D-erythritol 2,4-cyclodiphosphate synthase n=1 Tax=unclassified Roseitalea TaxID=2639107 RepID=UPI00273E7BCD|nr:MULTISPECIES: bifunctional 2-C-methyl-D-erythritol 4-phosphate cytidylyltransferase/2-C-methyl-D-erythritol 2,4-cyclodiphosphate synthase [unclassified Roseitalea]
MADTTATADAQPPDATLGLVIVAAGRGARSGLDAGPKQYHPLAGRALISHTLDAFSGTVAPARTCVVIHADDDGRLDEALGPDRRAGLIVAHGGDSRQASVLAGLEALARTAPDTGHVMIHDAARPFVTADLLARIGQAMRDHPAAGLLPVLPIAETIKRVGNANLVEQTIDRKGLFTAQTPQTFPLAPILSVHRRAGAEGRSDFTDDAALFEWAGLPVRTVGGDGANVKLTYRPDFAMAEQALQPRMTALPDVRTGNGYDVHRFGPGDRVTLCGIDIAHDKALTGHSDADVGLHALTDALLATCGAGDIGDHFPPSDPQWKGAPSSIFVQRAAEIVRDHGGTIMNADVSIIAEAPKIAPHRQAMRETMARLLGIETQRCSVKATTNETMGFVGRCEGMAAIATASVVYGPTRTRSDHG